THAGGIGTLCKDPLSTWIDSRVLKQRRQPDTRPFGAGQEAVNGLHSELGRFLLIKQRAVARALDERDARFHWVAHELIEREDERALDETVNHKPVRFRIDVGNPAVMPLEMQSVRRDRSVE